ncbi:preprotein translocase subunit YajC [Nocardia jejuensis]|uniref:preprotein translocase subunit YajC n=1 Tax=Nocardia jejuensis TaxID=328049 RepID=UPI00082CC61E|nr:preprotein translocase subunit YajC [Nocardia jejuensis]
MDLLLPLLLVALLIPMFLGVRRQKRAMAEVTEMQDGVKVGDRVVMTSGIYGTVVELDEDTLDLEIAEDVVTTWKRKSILEVRKDDADTVEDIEDAEPENIEAAPGEIAAPIEATSAAPIEAASAAPIDAAAHEDAPRLTKD